MTDEDAKRLAEIREGLDEDSLCGLGRNEIPAPPARRSAGRAAVAADRDRAEGWGASSRLLHASCRSADSGLLAKRSRLVWRTR